VIVVHVGLPLYHNLIQPQQRKLVYSPDVMFTLGYAITALRMFNARSTYKNGFIKFGM